jgi:DNA-binding LacI/PurR family transcriptional regulator
MGAMETMDRARIGLVLVRPDIEGDLLKGVTTAAVAANLDVICFGGGYLSERGPGHAVYTLAGEVPVDGIIVCTAMATGVFEDEIGALCARYAHVPVVTGALGLAEYPSVAAESYSGVYDVVSHLIEIHDRRRIAHIAGPPGQSEAAERFRAYRTALEDHGIPFDADFVATGDFTVESGVTAMRLLVERFWTEGSGLALDAVVSSNDEMAVGAHQVLTQLGVRLPQDLALVGFDDAEEGWSLVPSLTTVRQLREVVGQRMVEIMLQMLDGETAPDFEVISGLHRVPSEVVLRRSCGCMPHAVTRAATLTGTFVPDMIGESTEWWTQNWADSGELDEVEGSALWQALLRNIGVSPESMGMNGAHASDDFLMTVDADLRDLYAEMGDPEVFQDRLSLLRHQLVAVGRWAGADRDAVSNAPPLSAAQVVQGEDLLHQARILTGDIGRRIEAARGSSDARRSELLRALDTEVSSVIDLAGLVEPLGRFFPQAHIRELYVVLQNGAEVETDRSSPSSDARTPQFTWPEFSRQRRLILSYRDGEAKVTDIGFAAPYLLPDSLDPPASRVLITMPLVFRNRLFGYMVISYVEDEVQGLGPQQANQLLGGSDKSRQVIYQQISEELSSVLYRVQLVAEAEIARREAEVSLAEIRRTRQIADRVRRAPDAEAIMRVALEELSEVLGTTRAVARLGTRTLASGELSVPPDVEPANRDDV